MPGCLPFPLDRSAVVRDGNLSRSAGFQIGSMSVNSVAPTKPRSDDERNPNLNGSRSPVNDTLRRSRELTVQHVWSPAQTR